MFSFFKSNNPGVVIFYLVYLFAFRICFRFIDINTDYVFNHHEPLSVLLFGWLGGLNVNYKILGAVLSGLLCFVQALLINGIINSNKITAKKNYLGGLIFILFASFFKENLLLSPASLSFTFIIMATGKLFALTRKEKSYGDIFDIGFLVALASLFYFPAVLFIIFAYAGLSAVRAFSYREWAAIFLGFISPFIVFFTLYFFTGYTPARALPNTFLSGVKMFSIYDWLQLAAFALCALASFILLPGYLYSSLIQVRKFTTTLIVVFIITLVSFLLQQNVSLNHFIFLSLPISIVSSMVLFQIKKPIVSEVIHLMLILLVLAGQYLPLLKLF